MKFHLAAALILALGSGGQAFAQDATPPDMTPTPVFPKPASIPVKERIPNARHYGLPRPPSQSLDGTPVTLDNDLDNVPLDQSMADLADPSALDQLSSANKADSVPQKYYWHSFKSGNYCHVKKDGHDWYGWQKDGAFHWVLWSGGRFWWRDDYADRWIYYDQGYWWWQNPKTASFQVFLQDGHYHVCDANGVLGDDLMRTGTEEVATQPVEKDTPTDRDKNWDKGLGGGKEMGAKGPSDD